MTTIDLKNFIETGNFGTITLGSSKQHVIGLFGSDHEILDCGLVEILKYESWEFSCFKESQRVFGIANDWLHSMQVPNEHIWMETWFITEEKLPSFSEVRQQLEQNKIPFSIENSPGFNNEDYIQCTNSKVTLDFQTLANKPTADFPLLGIRLYEF